VCGRDDRVVGVRGDGNCAEVDWTFLGLSVADRLLVLSAGIGAAGAWLYRCPRRVMF